MTFFKVGDEYSHSTIVSAFGGDQMSYLPQVAGRIVCGRFKAGEMNPNAPYEILTGGTSQVVRKAELLASQIEPIPVFIKEGVNRWRFHGQMRCARYETKQEALTSAAGSTSRGAELIFGMLTMVDTHALEEHVSKPQTPANRTQISHNVLGDRGGETPHPSGLQNSHVASRPASGLSMTVFVIITFVAWVVALSGAVVAGTVVGGIGLLAAAMGGRRRRSRRRIW